MKLFRPYIPMRVRCVVIARQLQHSGRLRDVLEAANLYPTTPRSQLAHMLDCQFGFEDVHLDHDPPLCLREIIDAEKGIYKPDANDPRYLVYRTAEEHRIKTFIRGEGAQFSDAAKRRRKLKLERPPRPNRWPPKGSRPLRSRPMRPPP